MTDNTTFLYLSLIQECCALKEYNIKCSVPRFRQSSYLIDTTDETQSTSTLSSDRERESRKVRKRVKGVENGTKLTSPVIME